MPPTDDEQQVQEQVQEPESEKPSSTDEATSQTEPEWAKNLREQYAEEPKWARDLRERLDTKSDEEDDGILSVEELPDLIEEVSEAVEETVDAVKEAAPIHEFGLFRKLWGNRKE